MFSSTAGLTTRLSDGTLRMTATSRDAFRRYPRGHFLGHPGVSIDRLLDRHLDHLDDWIRASGLSVSPFKPEEGVTISLRLAKESAAQLAEKGIFIELTSEEIEEYRDKFEPNR